VLDTAEQGQGNTVLLSGELQYPIKAEDIQECWQVCTRNAGKSKYLEITLMKLSPVPGAVQWWGRIFADETHIDLTQIPARLRQQQTQTSNSSQFQENWLKAHSMFRERIAKGAHRQQEIVTKNDGADGGDDDDGGGGGRDREMS